MALYNSYLTSWCPHEWLQMLFLFYLFIWTGNVSVTFQMFWALHWQKPFTGNDDQMHMLWLRLAGLMDMFVIFLSPSALYSGQTPRESDLIHCQSSIPFPSLAVARREQRSTIPAVPACRHARASLYHPVGWQSTWGYYPVPNQLQQVLPYVVRKCSVSKRPGALTISQVIHKWPFKCLSKFWECGSKVLMAGTYRCKEMPLLSLYSSFFDVQRRFSFQKVLKQYPSKSWPAVPEIPPEELWLLFVCLY